MWPALPYEIYIVGSKVYALYGRYRIALAWPALGMGQFMGIVNAPEAIRTTIDAASPAGPKKATDASPDMERP
ncbi:MAG: hypothetical protein MZV65_15325 [Chromatiales bacterium]|nr:hypothetical protein [Chromatiales bacterium]